MQKVKDKITIELEVWPYLNILYVCDKWSLHSTEVDNEEVYIHKHLVGESRLETFINILITAASSLSKTVIRSLFSTTHCMLTMEN